MALTLTLWLGLAVALKCASSTSRVAERLRATTHTAGRQVAGAHRVSAAAMVPRCTAWPEEKAFRGLPERGTPGRHCQVVGSERAAKQPARLSSSSRCHLNARLLPPQPEGFDASAKRQQSLTAHLVGKSKVQGAD
jgi:hypothetical protein